MSQADELLNSLSDADVSLALANPETEPHIVIGEDRVISVPKELQRIAVQYDHDVETVTFDCPRYWDGLDMSQMSVYINYMRADRQVDCYKAKNIVAEDSIMHFDWTISRSVSLVKGSLKFLVCIKKGDTDGNEVNHWNSELNTEMYISEGLEVDGESILSDYPDIILQWESEVQDVKNILLNARDSGELDGATFTPSVDLDGNLSWTNDKGRENPETVNIKGYSPVILVREIEGGRELIITDQRQSQTVQIMDGTDGDDGYSPVILVREIEGGRQLIITDQRQSQTVTIMDGTDGTDGTDGVSPTIAIETIAGGHTVTITDKNGANSFDVLDGSDGLSPTVTVTAIAGGHEVTIGSETFTVMDGKDGTGSLTSEDMTNALNGFVSIGDTEPTLGPILWFDTSATSS